MMKNGINIIYKINIIFTFYFIFKYKIKYYL